MDQSFINNALYEQRCLENIKNVYKHAGKSDKQKKYKDIIEAALVLTL